MSKLELHCYLFDNDYLTTISSSASSVKGLAISSMPSLGDIKLTWVPRHTTRPSVLVLSVILYWSSGSKISEFKQ